MPFPVLQTVRDTLLNWSPQLNAINQDLQDNQDRYILNVVVPTNKTWIDGSRIFRKVIEFGALPNTTFKSIPHNIVDARMFLPLQGISSNTAGVYIPINWQNVVHSRISGGDVLIAATDDRTAFTETYIILEFVK